MDCLKEGGRVERSRPRSIRQHNECQFDDHRGVPSPTRMLFCLRFGIIGKILRTSVINPALPSTIITADVSHARPKGEESDDRLVRGGARAWPARLEDVLSSPRSDADAADCFQSTFLAAFQLSNREQVRHWPAVLVRLATARSIERLRSNLGPISGPNRSMRATPCPTVR